MKNLSHSNELPLVSVVIATYNRANEIMRAIDSVRGQNYPNKEIIVVNDGSTDNTRQILEQQSDIVLINNKTNLRLQKSLNIGCRASRGKYIARLDDHDMWIDSSKLQKQVNFLESHPQVGVLGTSANLGEREISNPLTDKKIRHQILFRCPFSHMTIMMRKEAYEKCGQYDEALIYSEDWDLWMKIGQKYELANIPDITTFINEQEGLTSKFLVSQYQCTKVLLGRYRYTYPYFIISSFYHWWVRQCFRLFKAKSSVHKLFVRIYDYFFLRFQ